MFNMRCGECTTRIVNSCKVIKWLQNAKKKYFQVNLNNLNLCKINNTKNIQNKLMNK